MLRARTALLLVFVASAPSLHAQYGRSRVPQTGKGVGSLNAPLVTFRGKLREITGKQIIIDNEDDQPVTIGRSHKTKFFRDSKTIKPSEITPGTPLSIDIVKDPDLNPLAVNVVVEKK